MLGKGLESLIPPQKNDPGQAPEAPDIDQSSPPLSTSAAAAPQVNSLPEPELPAEPEAARPVEMDSFAVKKEERPKKILQESIFHIEVKKIQPNPNQPRRRFAEQGIRELAYSVREFVP